MKCYKTNGRCRIKKNENISRSRIDKMLMDLMRNQILPSPRQEDTQLLKNRWPAAVAEDGLRGGEAFLEYGFLMGRVYNKKNKLKNRLGLKNKKMNYKQMKT